jgi:hypothetical protein
LGLPDDPARLRRLEWLLLAACPVAAAIAYTRSITNAARASTLAFGSSTSS